MRNYAAYRGEELARFLDLNLSRSLLDLGCGSGAYAFSLGVKYPHLELSLVDLPEMLEVAKEIQKEYPLSNRIRYLAANILDEEVGGSYDVILLSNTLHGLGYVLSRQVIRRLYDMVNPGGSLIVQAQYLRDDRLGGRWPLMLDLILLCTTTDGANHSFEETRGWLLEAGFRKAEVCPMSILNANSFITAYK